MTAERTPRVKICGVASEADRDLVVAAGADAVGVICEVTVDTHREVAPERARNLIAGVPPLVAGVLVTMPTAVQGAVRLVESVSPDVVQVHAGLAPTEVATLGRRVDAKVLAAVDPTGTDIAAYAEAADALLVDSVDASGGGGTGRTHDWTRTGEIVATLDVPVVLAGGLTPENVARAVRTVNPFGVDVASGVEGEDGGKDEAAVRSFLARARGAHEEVTP